MVRDVIYTFWQQRGGSGEGWLRQHGDRRVKPRTSYTVRVRFGGTRLRLLDGLDRGDQQRQLQLHGVRKRTRIESSQFADALKVAANGVAVLS